jgi:hypothetical protein
MAEETDRFASNGNQDFQQFAHAAAFGDQDKLLRGLMERLESQTAQAMEQFVAGQGFGELLARVTENTVALTKISADIGDLMLRNLGLAGRSDINRLARQLARTEDKLELLLQAVHRLESTEDRA